MLFGFSYVDVSPNCELTRWQEPTYRTISFQTHVDRRNHDLQKNTVCRFAFNDN